MEEVKKESTSKKVVKGIFKVIYKIISILITLVIIFEVGIGVINMGTRMNGELLRFYLENSNINW